MARQGVPRRFVDELAEIFGLQCLRFAPQLTLRPHPAALQPRPAPSPGPSERALQIARVLERTIEVLGSRENAVGWLTDRTAPSKLCRWSSWGRPSAPRGCCRSWGASRTRSIRDPLPCNAGRFSGNLSGGGARRNGGRWNPVGVPALYTSNSTALCLLEILVNVKSEYLPDLQPGRHRGPRRVGSPRRPGLLSGSSTVRELRTAMGERSEVGRAQSGLVGPFLTARMRSTSS